LLFVFLFLLVTALAVSNYQAKGDPEHIAGVGPYKMLIVLSDSMKPVFAAGDVIIVDASAKSIYAEGDIITFWRSRNPQMLLTHRIDGVEEIAGIKYYSTRGDANNTGDGAAVRQEEILGRHLFKLPMAGYMVNLVHTRIGFIMLIVLPLLLAGGYEFKKLVHKCTLKRKPGSPARDTHNMELERGIP
jgi:signal peptidase